MRLRSCPAKEPAIDDALKGLTLPLTQIDGKTTPQSLSKTMKEHQEAQKLRTEKCFSPKAYKLLIKAKYNPQEQSPLGKLPQNSSSQNPRAGLGYEQPRGPVRIAIRRASSSNVTTEDCSSKIEQEPTRVSVFKRLGPLKAKKCWKPKGGITKPSIQDEKLRSLIPSRMRRKTDLVLSCDRVLKAKFQTIVFTKAQDEDDRESIGSSNHITLSEERDPAEEDADVASSQMEPGTKSTMDELREVNLGDNDDPRPIYVGAMLENEEADVYIELLKEFRDVFA